MVMATPRGSGALTPERPTTKQPLRTRRAAPPEMEWIPACREHLPHLTLLMPKQQLQRRPEGGLCFLLTPSSLGGGEPVQPAPSGEYRK